MDEPSQAAEDQPSDDLTLHDAAELYEVSARTLAQHLRCGQLAGYKSRGATGREWRVTSDALEAAGYRRRPTPEPATSVSATPARLQQELAAAKRALAAERHRADDIDRRLGHALLECGRLRAALAATTGQELPAADGHLDPATARWLMTAVRDRIADLRQEAGPPSSRADHRGSPSGIPVSSSEPAPSAQPTPGPAPAAS